MSNTAGLRDDGKPAAYDLTGQETGRPTSYRPEYCEKVIEWGRQGKSRTWMAAALEVDRVTIDRWSNAYKDFCIALTRAKALEQMWWEDKGQECLIMPQGSSFSQSVWSRSMAARFPDDWRETSRQEQTGPGGGPIQVAKVERVIVDPNNSDA